VLGPEHAHTLMSMNNLGEVYEREDRLDEAQALMSKTRAIQARVLGPNHPDTALSTYNLGLLAARRGQPDEAFRLLNEALDHGLSVEYGMNLRDEPELRSIHDDPRLPALVAKAESRSAPRK